MKAAELPLEDAVALVGLSPRVSTMAEFERAAVRWLARYAKERQPSLGEVQLAAGALATLREAPGRRAPSPRRSQPVRTPAPERYPLRLERLGSLVGIKETRPDRLEAHLLATQDVHRARLLKVALRLSYFTVGWNGVAGGTARIAAATGRAVQRSPRFALNALLDSCASAILGWRFRTEKGYLDTAERLEGQGVHTWIAAAMILVGLYVVVEGLRAGTDRWLSCRRVRLRHHARHPFDRRAAVARTPEATGGFRRCQVGRFAAMESSPCLAAALAAITLTALLVNSTLGWWWADPAAALIIGAVLAAEGGRVSIRHRFG